MSVLPSATEVVCALGARSDLVGRSAECDYPAEVASLPVVMRPRTLDSERPSAEIDARVRRVRATGESLYELDVPLLRTLRPDVLFTQDLCGVCSVTQAEVAQACTNAGVAPTVVSLSPHTLEEVWTSVETVGRAIDRTATARRAAAAFRRRAAPTPSSPSPRVAVVEWLDPPILAGLWTPAMIEAAGGLPVGPGPGEPGARTSWTELASREVDVLVLSPCSFSVARTTRELRAPGLLEQAGRVTSPTRTFIADEAYFSRPGPRLADGIDLLRSLIRGGRGPYPMPVARLDSVGSRVAA